MSVLEMHTVEVVDGSNIQNSDRVVLGILNNVANLAGFGAGNPVTTAVSFPTLTPLPPNYSVKITPSQACLVSVTNKTWNGFNVTLTSAKRRHVGGRNVRRDGHRLDFGYTKLRPSLLP